jgi:hypothetical protein
MLKGIESPCLIVLSCAEIINAFQYGFHPALRLIEKLRFSVGVGRPLSNPHKIVWALQLASTCAIKDGRMIGMEVYRRMTPVEAYDKAWKLEA